MNTHQPLDCATHVHIVKIYLTSRVHAHIHSYLQALEGPSVIIFAMPDNS